MTSSVGAIEVSKNWLEEPEVRMLVRFHPGSVQNGSTWQLFQRPYARGFDR